MSGSPLPQLVRDLMRLGVGLVVGGETGASFTLPKDEPERSRAEKAVNASLETLRLHHGEVMRLWPELAAEDGNEPVRCCAACRAWVFVVPEVVTWAFCESPSCPFRTKARRGEWKRRQQAASEATPIPE